MNNASLRAAWEISSRWTQYVLCSFGEESKMVFLQTSLMCVRISMQGGPQDWQYYFRPNLNLQQGHATS